MSFFFLKTCKLQLTTIFLVFLSAAPLFPIFSQTAHKSYLPRKLLNRCDKNSSGLMQLLTSRVAKLYCCITALPSGATRILKTLCAYWNYPAVPLGVYALKSREHLPRDNSHNHITYRTRKHVLHLHLIIFELAGSAPGIAHKDMSRVSAGRTTGCVYIF